MTLRLVLTFTVLALASGCGPAPPPAHEGRGAWCHLDRDCDGLGAPPAGREWSCSNRMECGEQFPEEACGDDQVYVTCGCVDRCGDGARCRHDMSCVDGLCYHMGHCELLDSNRAEPE
jgi:hypothetical protein